MPPLWAQEVRLVSRVPSTTYPGIPIWLPTSPHPTHPPAYPRSHAPLPTYPTCLPTYPDIGMATILMHHTHPAAHHLPTYPPTYPHPRTHTCMPPCPPPDLPTYPPTYPDANMVTVLIHHTHLPTTHPINYPPTYPHTNTPAYPPTPHLTCIPTHLHTLTPPIPDLLHTYPPAAFNYQQANNLTAPPPHTHTHTQHGAEWTK